MTRKEKLTFFFQHDYRDFLEAYGYDEAQAERTVKSLTNIYVNGLHPDRVHRFSKQVLDTFPELQEMLNEPDEA